MHYIGVLSYCGAAGAGVLLIFALSHEPPSQVRRFFVLGLLVLALESMLAGLAASAAQPDVAMRWLKARLIAVALLPGSWLLFSLAYSRGDRETLLRAWRPVVIGSFAVPLALVLLFWNRMLSAPAGADELHGGVLLTRAGSAVLVVSLLGLVLVLMNMERTLRASVGVMRWRIKYMVIGLGVVLATRLYTTSQAIVYSASDPSVDVLNPCALLIGCAIMLGSLLRAPLLKVDLYLSHTVLYHSFTVLLVAVYLLAVGILAHLATRLGDVRGFPVKAFVVFMALIGLPILLTSDRVRQRTRRFISAHLRRPRYDYRRVWDAFTRRTASHMAAPDYCRAVAQVVSDTFEVLSVTIWLLDESRDRLAFGGSTSLQAGHVSDLVPAGQAAELLAALRQRDEPIDIDASREPWVAALRRGNPDTFESGGNRLCLPLSAGGELVGLLALGDRVSGVPFTVEDFDLLKTIGHQIASTLLNLRLSQRLFEAKEMEAFQAMSAFFVHDLKNTAATLSLMVQNLPRHFENPTFREDAIRAMAQSVTKIDDLIQRLTLLRQHLTIQAAPADLSAVVAQALAGLDPGTAARLERDLQPLPPVPLDPEQVQKIALNLVLNALDATDEEGQIRVSTEWRDGRAILTVRDNGCGMDREFIERSLFRPFRSSKKKGLGIGLFQSKRIAEAHGGRIEVSSEKGRGSTFRVLFPAARRRDT